LAEDNMVNQRLATLLLEKRDHQVTVVDNGKAAVKATQENDYDAVLMDVQMPILDGFEATRQIRRREMGTEKHVPIIALTAHAMKGDREVCFEAGMDGYVTKPIVAEQLFQSIERVLGGDGVPTNMVSTKPDVHPTSSPSGGSNRIAEGPSAVDAASPSACTGPRSTTREIPAGIDWDKALTHTGGDADLLGKMIRIFLDESKDLFARIRVAMDDEDHESVQRLAHSVKGSCGYFAAASAFEAARNLEQSGRNGEADERALMILQGEIDRLEPELRSFEQARTASALQS
jgi:CheY-like chemotaxis protein/HPt (histidine-containing phosphotransfer) domain-containing protein